MNVLLVSECDKNALKESRRVIDQFAERRGERTWQTAITQEGLDTLRRLLRKTARKNTAVACHWIRGRDHSELLWIVGNSSRFNAQGAVPTNTTSRDLLKREDENDWHTLPVIQLLADLAAMLHDLGKASVAFQRRLRSRAIERNLYRHEWVSLRLFQAFVCDSDDDDWLRRLSAPEEWDESMWIAQGRLQRDGLDAQDQRPFTHLPPLAAAVAWLVVTHHRLPEAPLDMRSHFNAAWLQDPLRLVAHDWNETNPALESATQRDREAYWTLHDRLPVMQPSWRARAAKLAQRLIALRQRDLRNWLDNPYTMHLARLCLMLADHHYSSLPKDAPQRAQSDGYTSLFANTDCDGSLKQPLDEHLIGVAKNASLLARALPDFERHLPRLANHRGLRKRSADPRFAWQDKAADAAGALREAARVHGAFIVNMASTGCGKTLANARILYALAEPQHGLRASYALGLRTLTMQTGRSYRADLHLSEDELAVLVGGAASRALFEYYEQQSQAQGSASIQSLLEEDSHVLYEGRVADHPLLSRALHDRSIRDLLSAPMLVCTVDHLAPATESLRAGRQIAPMLRLMSSDLVLDELDDYGLDDLPALTRLVYWAGLLGTRVVLSSATLPPALVEGMFMAYRAGRQHHAGNRGEPAGTQLCIPCLWADEFGVHASHCANAEDFSGNHGRFVENRSTKLSAQVALRRAELLPLDIQERDKARIRAEFAQRVQAACLRLHADHAEVCPVSGKRISFGIVRMANIDPLFDVARTLFELGAPQGVRIHLCVYHARFPLIQRSAIEHQLDTAFNRRDPAAIYRVPEVRAAIDEFAEPNHLFVVLASPVCEVGRDWDADWAVAEPSSMRALIQLAGRVQRHRQRPPDKPNLLVFDFNLRHFERGERKAPAFIRPGFEAETSNVDHPFRLLTHRLSKLLLPAEYETISALPRIRPLPRDQWQPKQRLVDLEHARMADRMLPHDSAPGSSEPPQALNAAAGWQYPRAALTGLLPQRQRFRDSRENFVTLVFLPDEEEEQLLLHRVEEPHRRHTTTALAPINRSMRQEISITHGPRILCWGGHELMGLLRQYADQVDMPLSKCAEKFASVTVPDRERGWRYHPTMGFASID